MNSQCPNCTQKIEVDDDGAGMTVECPTCHQEFTLPQASFIPETGVQPPPIPKQESELDALKKQVMEAAMGVASNISYITGDFSGQPAERVARALNLIGTLYAEIDAAPPEQRVQVAKEKLDDLKSMQKMGETRKSDFSLKAVLGFVNILIMVGVGACIILRMAGQGQTALILALVLVIFWVLVWLCRKSLD